jgi:uncharacterized membrane protein YesL
MMDLVAISLAAVGILIWSFVALAGLVAAGHGPSFTALSQKGKPAAREKAV